RYVPVDDLPESPIPIRSGARHRALALRCGMMLRHKYDEVGLPCRKTIGSPALVSTQAISVPSTATRFRGCGSLGEIVASLMERTSVIEEYGDHLSHASCLRFICNCARARGRIESRNFGTSRQGVRAMAERRRKFWGWGYEDQGPTPEQQKHMAERIAQRFGLGPIEITPAPKESELNLRAPRVKPPAALEAICSTSIHDRAGHTYGKGSRDLRRAFRRYYPNPIDVVGFPRDEKEL